MLWSVLLIWSLIGVSHSGAAAKQNFVFFQPDEMRAESLGCYGHNVSQTPNFDAFAAQGTRFEQAHVSYTVCSQSRTAFMTGWPTHVRGHRTLWALLHEWEPNLLKYFKQDNYTVKWWGKNDLLAPDSWNSSVDSAKTMGGQNAGSNPYDKDDPRFFSFLHEAAPSINHTADYKNVAEAISFLCSKPKEPFVIFLPLSLPHPPYGCPEPYYSSVNPDDLGELRPMDLAGKPDYHGLIRMYRNLTKIDQVEDARAFFRRLHAVYLGAISFSDFLFGLLLAAIEDNGFQDQTTVAVWSDHGDYAGDYGLVEKWPSGLEDVLTRVPLIIRTPDGRAGHVVHEQVQLYDIVPTFLALANISLQHVQFGISLVPQLMGAAGDPERVVYAEGGYATTEPRDFEGDPSQGPWPPDTQIYYPKILQEQENPLSVCRSVMVRTPTHKLIFRSDPTAVDHFSELYDLTKDPRELDNVYNNPTYAEIQAELKQKLLLWFLHTSDVTPWLEDPRGGQPGAMGGRWPTLEARQVRGLQYQNIINREDSLVFHG